MRFRTPRWLAEYCNRTLPPILRAVDGRRILDSVEKIVETDRWNSFDRFHETTETLLDSYRRAGARAELYRAQTGGQLGSGRWIIQEAMDVAAVTVDVVRPVRWRVANYRKNPWHAVQWSTSTPANGMVNELVVVDSKEALGRIPRSKLQGKVVLTSAQTYGNFRPWADKGVAGLLIETRVKGRPDATKWTKFGWGGVPIADAATRLVAVAVSENTGKRLRQLAKKHGTLTLKTHVDLRRYLGAHDVVSGIVAGRADPQDEVWALAHSAEPGAADNASGVAVCIEIARVVETLVAQGQLPRPKRSIRLLNAFECYGFFHYLENVKRLQAPLAGVCIDCVGIKPEFCGSVLGWHATIPMSAGFVNPLGEGIIRAALRKKNPGYRYRTEKFVSTSDTLVGDPKYGFPCPWLATYRQKKPGYDMYHSSADTPNILTPDGLAVSAAAMAAYLYWLADAESVSVVEMAAWETERTLAQIRESKKRLSPAQTDFVRAQHHVSLDRLKRWLWGGDRAAIPAHLGECERRVRDALERSARRKPQTQRVPGSSRVPRRKAPLSPTLENTPASIAARIRSADMPAWALFWADGNRDLAAIADTVSCELSKQVAPEKVAEFFEAHAELGYVDLIPPQDMVSRSRLVCDLKALGLRRGMDVMVHSSLSSLGHVIGGPDAVVDALLSAIGKKGTLLMPSFNHLRVPVFNPMTTPTTNGAIPDAMWRRPEAVRSVHPSHAVAAIGPKAQAYCRDHLEIGVWEQDSPIGRLVHWGGYILTLGDIGEARTAYHIAENAAGCTCVDPFGAQCRVVATDGRVRRVRGLAWRDGLCPVSPSTLSKALDRRKLQRHGTVGNAPATLVKAKDLWKIRRRQLLRICPTCTIKPREEHF